MNLKSDKSIVKYLDYYLGMHLLARALGGTAVLNRRISDGAVAIILGD